MTKETKESPRRDRASNTTSPVRHLERELLGLRAELRQTIRSYSARLEIQLAQSLTAIQQSGPAEQLPRESLHRLRDLTALVRKRRTKPEKGRRKDLRAIDELINDIHDSLAE